MRFDGPPVFLNSMPKSGTNLLETFFISLGYKRAYARCLDEWNVARARLRPRKGRFYLAHLADDALIPSNGQLYVLLTRPIWGCVKSYVNYMYIDTTHPVSRFVRDLPLEDSVERLFFSRDNPNGRPLVQEYLRFSGLDQSRYDLVLSFDDLIALDPELVARLARNLGATISETNAALSSAIEKESYTKNLGRINVFAACSPEWLAALEAKVYRYELASLD